MTELRSLASSYARPMPRSALALRWPTRLAEVWSHYRGVRAPTSSRRAARVVETELRLSPPCRRGAHLTLHFTYHVESLSMCRFPPRLGRRPRSQRRWDAFLPHLPSLADVGEPYSGLAMPFRALHAKPQGLIVRTHRLVLLPPSSGVTHLNLLGFARVPSP